MKLKKLLIVAILSGFAFTACKNDRGVDDVDDDIVEMDRIEREREAEMANQRRLDAENSVTARIGRNQNLSTFNEEMNRTQVAQSFNRNRTSATGTTGQTGSTTGQTGTNNQTGTTTGQTGTTTGQTGTTTGQTGTTTGQTGTTTGQTGMTGQTGQGYTIFAPSNDAYAGLTDAQRKEMSDSQNRDRNTASLNYLMVEQRLTEDQLRQEIQNANGTYNIRNMQGENITDTLEGNQVVLRDASGNQARIIESDTEASDGIVYVIDKVLRPKDPSQNAAATRTGTNNTNTNTNTNNNRDNTNTNTGTNTNRNNTGNTQ